MYTVIWVQRSVSVFVGLTFNDDDDDDETHYCD